LTYFDDFKLPPDSLYKSIEDTIFARAHGGGSPKRMNPEAYANKVVSVIVNGSSSKSWPGPVAGFIKFAAGYFPTWLMVRCGQGHDRPLQLTEWDIGQTIHQRYWGGCLVGKSLRIISQDPTSVWFRFRCSSVQPTLQATYIAQPLRANIYGVQGEYAQILSI
jgi:hypothetical protein